MPQVRSNEVNVTPLIDVVMCLIIFFMLVAKIGISTGAKPMDLPYSYLGKKIDEMGTTLTLNLLPVGDVERIKHPVAGRRPEMPKDIQVSALVDGVDRDLPLKTDLTGAQSHPLRAVLLEMKARYKDKCTVIIRADADLPFYLIEPVLAECNVAGIPHVDYTTTTKPPAGGP